MEISILNFFKDELDRIYNLVARAQSSMDTIQDGLDIIGIYTNNKIIKDKINNIQDAMELLHEFIENFKLYF